MCMRHTVFFVVKKKFAGGITISYFRPKLEIWHILTATCSHIRSCDSCVVKQGSVMGQGVTAQFGGNSIARDITTNASKCSIPSFMGGVS